ncbi:MAG: hypothetical protein MJA29_00615 [Candidatus Omnitrophica bacterium]|nr:hypothetical protein [Candidatus Omnitrophota bacterium]
MAEVRPGEEVDENQDVGQVNRVRIVIADTHTFVRSQEINRTIGSFTFDHYIDEARRQIKGSGTAIRNSAGEAIGVRPTKLEVLNVLETEFRASLEVARSLAKAADTGENEDDA